jgi:valyl-tRNA synthetase
VDELLIEYQFGEAERQVHDFFWGDFCDWYIEISKLRMARTNGTPLPLLVYILEASLRLLHPFMPFITEELWQNIKQRLPEGSLGTNSIIIADYPVSDKDAIDPEAEQNMEAIIEIVRAIRNSRAEYKVAPSKWIEAHVYSSDMAPVISSQKDVIETLAKARPLEILRRAQRQAGIEKSLVLVLNKSEVVLPWSDMVDIDAERQRLEKEIATSKNDIDRLQRRLEDNTFITKAPAVVVEKERSRLRAYEDKLSRLEQELKQLS